MTNLDISQITCCSIALINHPVDKAFELMAAAGYKNTDVLEKLPHLSLHPDEFDPEELRAASEKHGVRIANLNTYIGGGTSARASFWLECPDFELDNAQKYTELGFSSDDPKELEAELEMAYRAIDMGASLGVRTVRFVPGDEDPAKMDKIVPWLKRCAEYAEEKGVILVTENHGKLILGSPELVVEMLEKVGSPNMGVIYEPHNLMAQAGQDYRKAFETMRDHIKHVHFKDGRLVTRERNYEPTLMGEGEFDFCWVLRRLNEIGYQGELALEYEVPEVPADEGIKQFYDAFLEIMSRSDSRVATDRSFHSR
jgi:sugar phosphate isomerase/epimerase